jgi:hypothetical protein
MRWLWRHLSVWVDHDEEVWYAGADFTLEF